MKAFHVICGLSRSGSTLLGNIIAQNPSFHVLSTSPLPSLIEHFAQGVTNVPEIKGMLRRNEQQADEASCEAARGIVRAYHAGKEVCFDKNRLWSLNQFVLAQLYPDARIICIVRDLRACFGSAERRWRRNPLMQMPPGRTLRERMANQFAPDGMIGTALGGIEDLLLVQNKAVHFVKYEALCENPTLQMQNIYDHINEPRFDHDFDRVKNIAIDPDELYLNAFPHQGSGKVKDRTDWQSFVPPALADGIMQSYPWFNDTFGYR